MSITVQLTYDMGKALGQSSLEIDVAATVKEAVRQVRERFLEGGHDYDLLTRVTALAVNGVLTNYRKGLRTRLDSGDTLAFVKAAAGG